MEALGFILFWLLLCLGISMMVYAILENKPRIFLYGSIITSVVIIVYGVFCLKETDEPQAIQAIDVYRGKTILEITYRDSVPVDSVVVFKDKNNESKSN